MYRVSCIEVICEDLIQVIGFEREFSAGNGNEEVPKFWDEFHKKYKDIKSDSRKPKNATEQMICACNIGTYGICIDENGRNGNFRYMKVQFGFR